jgi:hypothetical protein
MGAARPHRAMHASLRYLIRGQRELRLAMLVLPLAIAVPVPDDSSYTHVRAMGGGGQYRYLVTNCGGGIDRNSRETYTDFGIEIEHQSRNNFGAGMRAGYVDDSVIFFQNPPVEAVGGSFWYANPYGSYNQRWFGIGGGVLFASEEVLSLEDVDAFSDSRSSIAPTISLRLLRLDKIYLTADLFSGVPLYSGGGYFSLGVGFRPVPRQGLWIGLGSPGPYDEAGLLLQSETRLEGRWYLCVNGRYGQSGDTDEFGVGAGITYRIFR